MRPGRVADLMLLPFAGCEASLSHKRVLLLQPCGKGGGDTCTGGEVGVLLQSSIDLLKSKEI